MEATRDEDQQTSPTTHATDGCSREENEGAMGEAAEATMALLDTASMEPSREEKDQAIKDEFARLPTQQCPPSHGGSELWQLAKRMVNGEDISRRLNGYLGKHLTQPKKAKVGPQCREKQSHRRRRRREFALMQELYRKNQARCAHEILDGKNANPSPDPEAFLTKWQEIMEKPCAAEVDVQRRENQPTDHFDTINPKEICAAMLPRNTAAGPDGMTGQHLRDVPLAILQVLLNMLALLRHVPACLRQARTISVPKLTTAKLPGDFRPITISPIIVRLFHKILATRLLAMLALDFRQRAFLPVDGCAENV